MDMKWIAYVHDIAWAARHDDERRGDGASRLRRQLAGRRGSRRRRQRRPLLRLGRGDRQVACRESRYARLCRAHRRAGDGVGLRGRSGNVVARWTYDAWGNVLSEEIADSAVELRTVRYRFQGREWSVATGLTNFRMRWYDAVTGRWLSKDPIRLNGGINLYVFCNCQPTFGKGCLRLRTWYLAVRHGVPSGTVPRSHNEQSGARRPGYGCETTVRTERLSCRDSNI